MDSEVENKLRADMGVKKKEVVSYTSDPEKIATITNPKTRAKVAQDRLDKKVEPNLAKGKNVEKYTAEKARLEEIID